MTDLEKEAACIKLYMNGEPVRIPQALYDRLPPELQAVCEVVKPLKL